MSFLNSLIILFDVLWWWLMACCLLIPILMYSFSGSRDLKKVFWESEKNKKIVVSLIFFIALLLIPKIFSSVLSDIFEIKIDVNFLANLIGGLLLLFVCLSFISFLRLDVENDESDKYFLSKLWESFSERVYSGWLFVFVGVIVFGVWYIFPDLVGYMFNEHVWSDQSRAEFLYEQQQELKEELQKAKAQDSNETSPSYSEMEIKSLPEFKEDTIYLPDGVGTFGDSFGVLNTLFSGLAFAGIIVTIVLQSKELRETRKELQGQKEEFERQNIDNRMIYMLSSLRDSRNSIVSFTRTSRTKLIGMEVFLLYFEYFITLMNGLNEESENVGSVVASEFSIYDSIRFSTMQPHVNMLLATIFFISKIENDSIKRGCVDFFKGDVSFYELFMVFWVCLDKKKCIQVFGELGVFSSVTSLDVKFLSPVAYIYGREAFGSLGGGGWLKYFNDIEQENEVMAIQCRKKYRINEADYQKFLKSKDS